jgi:hypothetical protein
VNSFVAETPFIYSFQLGVTAIILSDTTTFLADDLKLGLHGLTQIRSASSPQLAQVRFPAFLSVNVFMSVNENIKG